MEKILINSEKKLVEYLRKNWKKHFKFRLIGFDKPIRGIVSNKIIGIVDIIFCRYNKKYFVEIKFAKKNHEVRRKFWHSLKILGYTTNERLKGLKIKPIIMVKKGTVTNDTFSILYQLGIGYITFEIKNKNIDFKVNI